MRKLEKIKLNAKDCVSLTDSMMKSVLGGSGTTHTCWCNNTNIGSGFGHEDCAARCVKWCQSNPC